MKIKPTIITSIIIFCVGLILFSGYLVLNPISVSADDLAACTANCGGGVKVTCGGTWATTCTAIDGSGCTAGGGKRVESKSCSNIKKPGEDDEFEIEEELN
jgi:hypothetical protein